MRTIRTWSSARADLARGRRVSARTSMVRRLCARRKGGRMAALPVWRFIGSAVSLRRIFPLGLVLLAAFLPAPAAIAASQDAIKDDASAIRGLPCYHRGVAIHNMMNWAAVEPSNPGRYVSPAFIGPNYETSDALLRHVAAAGFDFIRLTIDPGPFLHFPAPAGKPSTAA